MEVAQLLHMNSGNGKTSYARNSSVQRRIISSTKVIIEEALREMLNTNICIGKSMGIADLGCSSGPNTLLVISQIINIVHEECLYLGRPTPEFNVLLNDLFTNDFNNVFASLPDFYNKMKKENKHCFVSGLPGSFYGRIFPAKSVHFVHSSSSLHWLSQVPAGLEGNKGKIYISKSSPKSVLEAYLFQFQKDLSVFLRSRSQEMVCGGRMVLSLMGRESTDPTTPHSCYQWELLAQALKTLVSKGLVKKEKVDSFNAPYYAPCPEEIMEQIEKEGSFTVDRLDSWEMDWDGRIYEDDDDETFEPVRSGLDVARTIRAVVEPMLECHGIGGKEVMDHLFQRYGKLVGDHLSNTRTKYIHLLIALTKKD